MQKSTFSLNQQKSRPHGARTLIAFIAILLMVLGSGGYYLYQRESDQSDRTQQPTSKDDPAKRDDDKGGNAIDSSAAEGEKKLPSQFEGTSPSNSNSLTGVINYKSVVGGNLVLRSTIDQALNSGTCNLRLTNSIGKIVTKSAPIAPNPSSSSCQGFDIPVGELGKGSWRIVIDLTDDADKTGTIKGEVSL